MEPQRGGQGPLRGHLAWALSQGLPPPSHRGLALRFLSQAAPAWGADSEHLSGLGETLRVPGPSLCCGCGLGLG